jgi:hypothetical protein
MHQSGFVVSPTRGPGCEKLIGDMEIGLEDLLQGLLANCIIVFAHAAPFLNKWAKCANRVQRIFVKHLSFCGASPEL